MKICLVRPTFVTVPGTIGIEIIPPLGLAYLAAYLRQAGHEVTVIDAVGEDIHSFTPISDIPGGMIRGLPDDALVSRIPVDTDVVGVSCMFSVNWVVNRRTIHAIRDRFPDTPIFIGGEHATAMAAYCLGDSPAVDFVVVGEGEETTAELVNALERGLPAASVPGLAFLQDGVYTRTNARARIRDLDALPLPAWDLVKIAPYLNNEITVGLDCGRAMPVIASRGCPYDCTFCSNPVMWGRLWRPRTPKKVVDEIEDYVRRYQINHIDFFDLTMITRRSWIVDFCNEMIERDLGVSWQIVTTRSEAIDLGVTQLLKKAGCNFVHYAPESGSPKVLAEIRKKMNIDKMLTSISAAVSSDLGVKLNYVLGFPNDRLGDVLASYWMAIRAAFRGANDASFFPYCPYPGSELFNREVAERRITINDSYFFDLATYNFARIKSQAVHFSDTQIRWLCILGTALFYGASLLSHPTYVVRLVQDIWRGHGRTKLSATLVRMRKNRRELKQSLGNA